MRIFLAAPFTQELDPGRSALRPDFRDWLQNLLEALTEAGHEVLSAHAREDWGQQLDPPDVALKADLSELRSADALVAFVGAPPSPGVQFELGIAVSLDIPIVLITVSDEVPPYLLAGLPAVATTQTIEIRPYEDASEKVRKALLDVEGRRGDS